MNDCQTLCLPDLSRLAPTVAVMYLGRIVERGSVDEVMNAPQHPYAQALHSAVPSPTLEQQRETIRLPGETPSPANPPSGCHFHPRCPRRMDECLQIYPGESPSSATHVVRCHLYR